MGTSGRTLGRLLEKRVKKSAKRNAVGWIQEGEVRFYTFEEYYNIIESLALGLKSIDLRPGDKIGILGNTCKEWHLIDMAGLTASYPIIPIYPTYLPEEVEYIFNHAEASILAVENEEQFDKVVQIQAQLDKLTTVISWRPLSQEKREQLKPGVAYLGLDELMEQGRLYKNEHPDGFQQAIQAQSEDDVASIIYTSGTTGEPKGALITQHGLCSMLKNVDEFASKAFGEQDRTLTFLPLSHVFGRVDSILPLVFGWEMVFAESIEKIVDNIATVKPTIMLAVPRIFEKIYAKINAQVEEGSFLKKKIFSWALEVSNHYHDKLDRDETPTAQDIIQQKLAYKLVFSKIYEKFGGRLRYFVSGGAPLSPEVMKFLRNAKLAILEGYGLTETIAPICINPFHRQIPGTVGIPMGDVQLKFDDDGEILIKTEGLFKEYFKNPEASQEVLVDGWFHSGDIGEFSAEGFLKITDRKKDIIITSGGKNVAPQKIENMMKTQRYISHFAVVGDKQKYLTGLVGIEKEKFEKKLEEMGLSPDCDHAQLARHPMTRELIQQDIDAVNQKLARYETIKNFSISEVEFTQDNYLTPSLKLKKKVLFKDCASEIDALYKVS